MEQIVEFIGISIGGFGVLATGLESLFTLTDYLKLKDVKEVSISEASSKFSEYKESRIAITGFVQAENSFEVIHT